MISKTTKKITPSILPYIAECPCWEREPSPPNAAMLRGTKLDKALRHALELSQQPMIKHSSTKDSIVEAMVSDMLKNGKQLSSSEQKALVTDRNAVMWAMDFILTSSDNKPVVSKKTDCKFQFTVYDVLISGEMDSFCKEKCKVFDLKSGSYANYEMQFLPYCLHMMSVCNTDRSYGTAVFCDKKIWKDYGFEQSQAEDKLMQIVSKRFDVNKTPNKCYGCRYCKFRDKATGGCRYNGELQPVVAKQTDA